MDNNLMVDNNGKTPPLSKVQLDQMLVAKRKRQLDNKMALLEHQQRKIWLLIQGYNQGLSNTLAASTPVVLPDKNDKPDKPLRSPKMALKSP